MSGHGNTYDGPGLHPLHLALFLVGGACLGSGIISLYGSFGWAGGADLNGDFAQIGFSALDNLALLPGAEVAVVLVVIGLVCLIYGNATAWRETGGY